MDVVVVYQPRPRKDTHDPKPRERGEERESRTRLGKTVREKEEREKRDARRGRRDSGLKISHFWPWARGTGQESSAGEGWSCSTQRSLAQPQPKGRGSLTRDRLRHASRVTTTEQLNVRAAGVCAGWTGVAAGLAGGQLAWLRWTEWI